jgi:hypothetical protein
MEDHMRILELSEDFRGVNTKFTPGRWKVPDQISENEARMAVADGAGRFVTGTEDESKPAGFPGKGGDLEDKGRGAAPENKQQVGSGAASGDSGERAQPPAGRAGAGGGSKRSSSRD